MADCKNGKQSPVETCSLTLRPDVGGKYTCQAANINDVCTILRCWNLKSPVSRDLFKWVIIIILLFLLLLLSLLLLLLLLLLLSL